MNWEFNHVLREEKFENFREMNITGILFNKEILTNEELKFQTLREVCFQNVKFVSCAWDNVFLAKVKFVNCEFLNVNVGESNFNKVEFINCKFTNVSFFEDNLSDLEIKESIMQYSKWENTKIDNSKWDGINLKENIFRHNKFKKMEFYKCEFSLDNFIDTKFIDCDLKTSHFKGVNINIDELVSSKLSILNMIEIVGDKGIILED